MGNVWGNRYIHAVAYNEPVGYHDKDRKKTKTKKATPKGQIQIVNVTQPPGERGKPQKVPKEQKKGVRKRMQAREKKHPAPPEQKMRSPVKKKGFKQNTKTRPPVINLDDQTEEEKAEKIPPSSELNERVEKANERTEKLEKALPAKKKDFCSNRI